MLIKTFPWVVNLYIPFLYMLAPSFYLYVKSLTHKKVEVSWKNSHWLSIVVGVILCLPYYLLDSEIKIQRLNAETGTLEHLGIFTIGPVLALIFLLIVAVIYIVLLLKLLKENLVNVKSYFSNIQNRDLSWIRWSVVLLISSTFLSATLLLMPPSMSDAWIVKIFFLVFELSWLVLIGIMTVDQKPIRVSSTGQDELKVDSGAAKKAKYVRSGINDIELKRLGEKIEACIEFKKLHLDPDLTMRKLSIETGISETRISQVLNTFFEQGFYDFINKLRIEYAIDIMKKSEDTLLKIALDSGFNSRSTFNLAFKKYKSITPSQFRQSLKSIT